MRNKKPSKLRKIVDETHKISHKHGNGIVRLTVNINDKGNIVHYSMAYINYRICSVDNGRVLGYDNSHGHHHHHFMGKKEPVTFDCYEAIAKQFEKEWREIHEKAK